MARSKHHKRTRSASPTSSTDSDPLHRPLLREAESEDDIEALQSIYAASSSDSDASSITGLERLGSDFKSFLSYLGILTLYKRLEKLVRMQKSKTEQHQRWRRRARKWLGSKYQHYLLISLIAIDVLCIFADIFISLYTCEEGKNTSKKVHHRLDKTQEALAIISLVFSCIFLTELLITLWAFGWRWLKSKFHVFDAVVIIASFVVDVVLHGVNSEVASLVVLLRLWRFVKIIEEISDTQEDRIEAFEEKVKKLKEENERMARELERWRQGHGGGEGQGEDLEAQRDSGTTSRDT